MSRHRVNEKYRSGIRKLSRLEGQSLEGLVVLRHPQQQLGKRWSAGRIEALQPFLLLGRQHHTEAIFGALQCPDESALVVPAITIFGVFQLLLREHGEA